MSSAASAGHSCDGTWSHGSCLSDWNLRRVGEPSQTYDHGKSPLFNRRYIFIHGWFSIVMLVFGGCNPNVDFNLGSISWRLLLSIHGWKTTGGFYYKPNLPHLQAGHKWGTKQLLRSCDSIPFSSPPFFARNSLGKLIESSVCDVSQRWTSTFPLVSKRNTTKKLISRHGVSPPRGIGTVGTNPSNEPCWPVRVGMSSPPQSY